MIHIATYRMLVADDHGTPVELDIGTLEHQIADTFRKLGFQDSWMAEEISLMLVEKMGVDGAKLLTRNEIDTMVVSMLTASGYADVAREYQSHCGHQLFEAERREMQPWHGRLEGVLRNALPIPETQLAPLARLCAESLEHTGIRIASDKYLLGLAIHLLVNHADGTEVGNPLAGGWRERLGALSRQQLEQGILRPLPVSIIFPRARLAVKLARLGEGRSGGWISVISMGSLLSELAPCILEILSAWRQELALQHPLQADSPSHLLFSDFSEYLGREPNLWRRRDREEIRKTVEGVIAEKVQAMADFPIALTLK